jgi:cytosine/adenosine deaminase-related metal-dependent hydrolase
MVRALGAHNKEEVDVFQRTGCGVAHCPVPTCAWHLASRPFGKHSAARGGGAGRGRFGFQRFLAPAGGSAAGHAAGARARRHRRRLAFRFGSPHFDRAPGIELATLAGRLCWARSDIGSLEVGKCADFIAINLNRLDYAGALHDPLAALLFCNPVGVDYNVIGGKFIVKEGQLQTLDLDTHIRKHNQAAERLLKGEK